jgi:hypothetical protein
MVWTIFKKDFRLLWPAAALMTALQAFLAFYEIIKAPFSMMWTHDAEPWLINSVLVGTAALAVFAVQQDPLPSLEADWLIRPITRSRLLLAKLMFLGAIVHVPMFALDVAVCLHAGGDIGQSLGAALSRSLLFFFGATLPLAAAAAITRNIAGFAATVFLYLLCVAVIRSLLLDAGIVMPPSMNETWGGGWWIAVIWRYMADALGAGLVLGLQYFRRKTSVSRVVLPFSVIAALLTPLLPWQAVYGVQGLLSSIPEARSGISVTYAPDLPRVHGDIDYPDADKKVSLYVPIQVSGLDKGKRLFADAQKVTVISAEGRTISEAGGFGRATRVNADGRLLDLSLLDPAEKTYVGFLLAKKDLASLDQPGTTLIVDYALTVGRQEGEDTTLRPTKDLVSVPRWGRCNTDLLGGGLTPPVIIQCVSAGDDRGLAVISAYAADDETPYARNVVQDYSPISAQLVPDALYRSAAVMFPLRLEPTQSLYASSRFVITHYSPLAHFRYRLVIHDIKLSDWSVLPNPT